MTAPEREALVKRLQYALAHPIEFDPTGWTAKTCGLVQDAIEALSNAPAVTVTEGAVMAKALAGIEQKALHWARTFAANPESEERWHSIARWARAALKSTTPQTGSQE